MSEPSGNPTRMYLVKVTRVLCFRVVTQWHVHCYHGGMKHILVVLMFLTTTSCARKAEVRAPQLVRTQRYSYIKGADGRLYIVTTNSKDFDEAMKTIHPGPASIDKLNLWVITPIGPTTRESH